MPVIYYVYIYEKFTRLMRVWLHSLNFVGIQSIEKGFRSTIKGSDLRSRGLDFGIYRLRFAISGSDFYSKVQICGQLVHICVLGEHICNLLLCVPPLISFSGSLDALPPGFVGMIILVTSAHLCGFWLHECCYRMPSRFCLASRFIDATSSIPIKAL